MPVNAKRLLLSVGGSNSGLWIYTHQTVPLNSSDISKGQKTAAYDWNPPWQRSLDKSRFKGENLN
jgi:hypothetical protein